MIIGRWSTILLSNFAPFRLFYIDLMVLIFQWSNFFRFFFIFGFFFRPPHNNPTTTPQQPQQQWHQAVNGKLPPKSDFPDFADFDVVHHYLQSNGPKCQARLRKRGQKGNWSYTHTLRRPHVHNQSVETKTQLTQRDYMNLLAQRDDAHFTIYKKRRCFLVNNQYFQLDMYKEPSHPRYNLKHTLLNVPLLCHVGAFKIHFCSVSIFKKKWSFQMQRPYAAWDVFIAGRWTTA